jgi:hypothetical protein
MKSILFIITLFVINFVNSQVIRVKVYEVLEHYEYDTSGVVGAVNTMSGTPEINVVDCEYIFDIQNREVKFYVNGILTNEVEFTFENNNSLFVIQLINPSEGVGFVLNTDTQNESLSWFYGNNDFYKIYKSTIFNFIKSS